MAAPIEVIESATIDSTSADQVFKPHINAAEGDGSFWSDDLQGVCTGTFVVYDRDSSGNVSRASVGGKQIKLDSLGNPMLGQLVLKWDPNLFGPNQTGAAGVYKGGFVAGGSGGTSADPDAQWKFVVTED